MTLLRRNFIKKFGLGAATLAVSPHIITSCKTEEQASIPFIDRLLPAPVGGGFESENGVNWKLSNPLKAYSRTVKWDNGKTTHQANFERPFLLIEDGKPTHLFAATGDGDSPWNFERTWNMVIPLK